MRSRALSTDPSVQDEIPKAPSLRKNFSWTALGNVIYALCQWGMLSVLAKLGSPEMVGQFALAVAVTTPIFAFANLQLRGIQATDARSDYQFGDYLALRYGTTVLALLVTAGVAFFSAYSDTAVLVLLLMGIGRALDAVSDVFYGRFQQQERMDVIARAMMINGILSIFGLSAGVLLTGALVAGVIGATIASAITLTLVFVLAQKKPSDARHGASTTSSGDAMAVRPNWSSSTMRSLFSLALPMGVVMFLVTFGGNIPRYVIEAFGDERQLGIYSAMAYLLVAGTTVVTALGQSASPRLARMFAVGDTVGFSVLLRRLITIGLILGCTGALLSIILGRQILSFLYTPEYSPYVNVLVVLAFSAGFSFAASFMGYGMTATRRFRSQVPLFIVVGGVNLVACLILVPSYGLVGAAWSVVAAGITNLVGSGMIVRNAVMDKRAEHAG